MIFIKKLPAHTPSNVWGICPLCKVKGPLEMLCQTCIDKRSDHFHKQILAVHSSWEYRIREWLCSILKPEIKFK